jgi:hypothetical protein
MQISWVHADLFRLKAEATCRSRGFRLQAEDQLMAKKIILNPVTPPARPTEEILAEIRTIYFNTTRGTILRDFDRAIDLLKTIATPEERQRATVYMDGLAEMRKEFNAAPSKRTSGPRGGPARRRSDR